MHHLADRGVAVLGLLGGGVLHHGGERGRALRAPALDVGQGLADVLHRHRHLRVGAERDLAREHLVEHDPERVDVRLLGDLVAERLLGRHVVGRAEHAAGGRKPVRLERARDAEVGDLGAPVHVDQHVLRLHVPVHQPVRMGALERATDLDRVRHGLGQRQAPEAPDALLERLALDVLEDDVGGAVVLAGVDHGDHMRVVELRHGARLAPEALELVGILGDVPVHQLDRHPALEGGVEGPVDRGHAARPDLLFEPVAVADQRPYHRHLFSALWWRYAFVITPILPVRPRGRWSPVFGFSGGSSAPRWTSPT